VRFACLGSGSKGNAWVLDAGATRVMFDCGFGARETGARLARLGLSLTALDAIVLSHEHSDHARGALAVARKAGCPIWATHGSVAQIAHHEDLDGVDLRRVQGHVPFVIGALELHPYPVPHDAREPVQYVATDGAFRWGLLTDAGHVTGHMSTVLQACDALVLECNHDVARLRAGSYPPALKARILGRYGHLDNVAAAGLLADIAHERLQHVVAAHLSEENNTPDMARQALASALGCQPGWVAVADQATGLGWREIT
jgi:phosphoribosyl 1,2-cyclic phosphodiesterase